MRSHQSSDSSIDFPWRSRIFGVGSFLASMLVVKGYTLLEKVNSISSAVLLFRLMTRSSTTSRELCLTHKATPVQIGNGVLFGETQNVYE